MDLSNQEFGDCARSKRSLLISDKSVLTVLSARSGSKSLARRSTRMLGGKPLCAWMIESARSSRLVDRLVVVSDEDEVRSFGKAIGLTTYAAGAPRESSSDPLAEVALLACRELPAYDFVVILDACSPLLLSSDIDGVLEVSFRNGGNPAVAVAETRLSLTNLVVLDGSRRMHRVFGNQDPVPANARVYDAHNAIAASSAAYLKTHGTFLTSDTHAYIVPPERALAIESKSDLVVAEGFLRLTGRGAAQPFLAPGNSLVNR